MSRPTWRFEWADGYRLHGPMARARVAYLLRAARSRGERIGRRPDRDGWIIGPESKAPLHLIREPDRPAPWAIHACALSRSPGIPLATARDPREAAEAALRLATERGEVVHLRAAGRYVTVPPGIDVDVLATLAADLADEWRVGR